MRFAADGHTLWDMSAWDTQVPDWGFDAGSLHEVVDGRGCRQSKIQLRAYRDQRMEEVAFGLEQPRPRQLAVGEN